MRSGILLAGLCSCLAASACGGGNIFKFDMGPTNSPVWEGFTQVTRDSLYDKTKGYGWEKTGGIKDEARRPAAGGGRIRPDDLCGDFVYEINSPFFLDAPDGQMLGRSMDYLHDLAFDLCRLFIELGIRYG